VAACQLAIRGASVLLLEKYIIPGGSSGYFERDGYVFDVGSSVMFGFGDKVSVCMCVTHSFLPYIFQLVHACVQHFQEYCCATRRSSPMDERRAEVQTNAQICSAHEQEFMLVSMCLVLFSFCRGM